MVTKEGGTGVRGLRLGEKGVCWPAPGHQLSWAGGLLYGMWMVEEWSERAMSREREGKGGWNRETCRKSCLEAQSQHPKPITAVRGRQGERRGPRSS